MIGGDDDEPIFVYKLLASCLNGRPQLGHTRIKPAYGKIHYGAVAIAMTNIVCVL